MATNIKQTFSTQTLQVPLSGPFSALLVMTGVANIDWQDKRDDDNWVGPETFTLDISDAHSIGAFSASDTAVVTASLNSIKKRIQMRRPGQ